MLFRIARHVYQAPLHILEMLPAHAPKADMAQDDPVVGPQPARTSQDTARNQVGRHQNSRRCQELTAAYFLSVVHGVFLAGQQTRRSTAYSSATRYRRHFCSLWFPIIPSPHWCRNIWAIGAFSTFFMPAGHPFENSPGRDTPGIALPGPVHTRRQCHSRLALSGTQRRSLSFAAGFTSLH